MLVLAAMATAAALVMIKMLVPKMMLLMWVAMVRARGCAWLRRCIMDVLFVGTAPAGWLEGGVRRQGGVLISSGGGQVSVTAVAFAALEEKVSVPRLAHQFLGQREDEGVVGSVGQQRNRRPEQQPQRRECAGDGP